MFSRECRLIDIHNPVQAKSSNTTWTPEFLPVKQPEWCFMESLLWVFYFSDMCCAIVVDFVTYMVGKFAHSLDIHVCRFHSSEKHVSVWHHSMKSTVKLVSNFLCWGISYRTASWMYPLQIFHVYCKSQWCICWRFIALIPQTPAAHFLISISHISFGIHLHFILWAML